MRILFEQVRGGSGADLWVERLAAALAKRGHEVQVHFHPHVYQYAPSLARLGPKPQLPPAWQPQIVHSSSWCAFAFKRPGTPLVVTNHLVVHAPALAPFKSWTQQLFHSHWVLKFEKKSFRAATAITAVSAHTQKQIQEVFAIPSKVIYNGVDEKVFRLDLAPQPPAGSQPGKLKLLWAGNPGQRKGSDLLLPVLQSLQGQAELWIAGGLRGDSLTSSNANVLQLGRVEPAQMPGLLAACDVFFFPSREEGLSLVVLEAMACGKPVVTSSASSLPELIVDGQGGFTCPTGELAAYSRALKTLAEQPQLRAEYGQFNRRRVEERFTLDRMTSSFEDLYRESIEKQGIK